MGAYTTSGRVTSYAPAFQIRWREDDLSLLETHPLTPGAPAWTTTNEESPTPTPTDTSGAQEESDEDNGGLGLSTGAVAGIAVGVAVFAILLCSAAFVWYRRRHLKPLAAGPEDAIDSEKTSGGATPPPKMKGIIGLQGPWSAAEMDGDATSIQRQSGRDTFLSHEMEGSIRLRPATPASEMDGETSSIQRQSGQGTILRESVQSGATAVSNMEGYAGERHELAGAQTQAQADIVELECVSPEPGARAECVSPEPGTGPECVSPEPGGRPECVSPEPEAEPAQDVAETRDGPATPASNGTGFQVRRKPVSGETWRS